MSDASDGNQRLSLQQVEEYVAAFSDSVVEELALGPVRDLAPTEPEYWKDGEKDCRVCKALEPIQEKSPPASALLDWHSFVSKSFEMLTKIITKKGITDEEEQGLQKELLELFGVLAYSRGVVIYAVARAEKLKREAERESSAQSATLVGG